MQIALWIVQVLLGLAFLAAGAMKLTQPKDKLYENGMTFVEDFDPNIVKLIGLLEVFGAVGLVFPVLLNFLPFLTPLAGAGLVLTMIGATIVHIRREELAKVVPNLVLGALAAFVVFGYVDLLPF